MFSGSVFVVESFFFVYSIYLNSKWGWDEFRASISLLLFFLASYQFSEVLICSFDKTQFGKTYGHVSITFLPPLGLWLIRAAETPTYGLEYIATLLALIFVWVFVSDTEAVRIITCEKCFVRYQYFGIATYYGKYYFGIIAIALFTLFLDISKIMKDSPVLRLDTLPLLILGGYLVFLFPTAVSVYIFKMDGSLVSSTMCKWASLFAIVLVLLLTKSS